MKIGIDLDNTIIDYSESFIEGVRYLKFKLPKSIETKEEIKRFLIKKNRSHWHQLQGIVYSKFLLSHGKLYPGVKSFLLRCKAKGHKVIVISHKSKKAHHQSSDINLRKIAEKWLILKKIFNTNESLIQKLIFNENFKGKISEINKNKPDIFIDDLRKVISSPNLDKKIIKIHFSINNKDEKSNTKKMMNWHEIDNFINGHITSREVRKILSSELVKNPLTIKKISQGRNAQSFQLKYINYSKFIKFYPLDKNLYRLKNEIKAYKLLNINNFKDITDVYKIGSRYNFVIFDCIEGKKKKKINDDYIHQTVNFIKKLYNLSLSKTIKNIEYASAACFNFKDIKSQIDNRINEFQPYRKKYKKLDIFFNNDFIPLLDKMIKETEKKQKPLSKKKNFFKNNKTLSPSDFGFHNAKLNKNDTLIFFDFEYFEII